MVTDGVVPIMELDYPVTFWRRRVPLPPSRWSGKRSDNVSGKIIKLSGYQAIVTSTQRQQWRCTPPRALDIRVVAIQFRVVNNYERICQFELHKKYRNHWKTGKIKYKSSVKKTGLSRSYRSVYGGNTAIAKLLKCLTINWLQSFFQIIFIVILCDVL